MAGAGLLIPIPNSGPRPHRRPREAGEQQLTPRPAVPRSPGPAPRSPGRWLASDLARRPAGRLAGCAKTRWPGWTEPGDLPDPVVQAPTGLCLPGQRRPGWRASWVRRGRSRLGWRAGWVSRGRAGRRWFGAGRVSAGAAGPPAGQRDGRGYRKQFPPVLIKSRRRGPCFGAVFARALAGLASRQDL